MDAGGFRLESRRVGALPLVNHYMERLGWEARVAAHLPAGVRAAQVAHRLGLLVRNVLIAREPLYAVPEWAAGFHEGLLGLAPGQGVSDDALGRALDHLFDADRASLQTSLVAHVLEAFEIDVSELHNDSTTITFAGEYEDADGRRVRGKSTLVVTFGHNKDHRPDLKQLLWSLTVSRDGAVPVHYRVFDGNTNDSPTHPQVWDALVGLVGVPGSST